MEGYKGYLKQTLIGCAIASTVSWGFGFSWDAILFGCFVMAVFTARSYIV